MGAEGSFSSWARPEKPAQSALICASVGLQPSLNFIKQAAMCPSWQATRKHWAVMEGPWASVSFPSSTEPHSFMGSRSLFSSSPPM